MGRGRGVDRKKNTRVLGCRDVKDASLADGTVLLVDADIRERGEGEASRRDRYQPITYLLVYTQRGWLN